MQKKAAPLARITFALLAGTVFQAAACSSGSSPMTVPVDGSTPPPSDANATPYPCSIGSTMPQIQEKLFKGIKCLGCHGKLTLFPTTLDLASDGLAARVVDRMAEANPAKGKCVGKVLVPRDNPTGGVFVEKVEQAKPSCGARMPQDLAALTPDEISCVKAWVYMAAQGEH
jgi:hypothetical protein